MVSAPAQGYPTLPAARAYIAKGIAVFSIRPWDDPELDPKERGKAPATQHGLKDATTAAETIEEWWQRWPTNNIGIATGAKAGFWVLDIDGEKGAASLAALETEHGALPETPEQTTARGRHICFAWDPEHPIKNSAGRIGGKFDERGKLVEASGIDARGEGGYIVAAPSKHATGVHYAWHPERRPSKMAFAPAPEWLVALAEKKPEPARAAAGPRPERSPAPAAQQGSRLITPYGEKILREECEKIATAVDGTVENTLNDCSFLVGTIVGAGEIKEEIARAALIEAGMKVVKPPWTIVQISEKVERAMSAGILKPRVKPELPPRRYSAPAEWPQAAVIDIRTREELPSAPISEEQARAVMARASADDARPPNFSDEALALRFADKHADDLRYVASWGAWLQWTGTHWLHDKTLLAFDLIRPVCRGIAATCERENTAKALTSAKTVAAVEKLAKADRRIAATTDQWDADPWLLNTPAGVIDLRTGHLRQHDPRDHLTKITAVAPGGGDCPNWLAFLDRVTAGDRDLEAFLQRIFGYALTGDTSAHALFFAFGTGANGKSVALDTLAGILGDYHRTAPIETFTASVSERHPTELAGLRGARLVTAIETEEGRRWAESRIKTLTGGDRISARFMRQDFFEFVPQFKLLIAGNHKPGLRSVDEAMRRRFHLIPFSVTIPPEERDPALRDKLKAEWPGILQWMVDGCLDWQRDGLAAPQVVRDATAAYLDAEDALAGWIEEACSRDPQAWTSTTVLFASWKAWADKAGEHVGSVRRFAQTLEARGFDAFRTKTGRGFQGLAVLRSIEVPPHWSDR